MGPGFRDWGLGFREETLSLSLSSMRELNVSDDLNP
jgi:hypothetical protein